MTMARTYEKFDDVAREAAARRAKKREDQEGTLAGLRNREGVTQAELAAAIGIAQPSLAEREARDDAVVSALREYVAGLGGELELVAVIPGRKRYPLTIGVGE